MDENEQGTQSPMELLRRLIEESEKWTKDLVIFTRTLVIVAVILSGFFIYTYSRSVLEFLSRDGPVIPVILGIPLIVLIVYGAKFTYHNFRILLHRRDTWKNRFDILKKREEELEKLLDEEAS